MPPFAQFLGVRAGEDLDDVMEPDAETAPLADAKDAGEEFLRGDGAVESLARRRGNCRSRRKSRPANSSPK